MNKVEAISKLFEQTQWNFSTRKLKLKVLEREPCVYLKHLLNSNNLKD